MMILTNMISHVNICAEAHSSSDCDHGSWPLWILNINMCTIIIIIINNLKVYIWLSLNINMSVPRHRVDKIIISSASHYYRYQRYDDAY